MRRRPKAKPAHESAIESETKWVLQAKFTFFLVVANFVMYIISHYFWTEELFKSLIFTRESLLALNFLPMIASWFLHANWVHLTGNILFLLIFGRVVERRYGLLKAVFIYFGAAIISDVVAGLVFGQGGLGASGAIMGLVAAAVIIDPFYLTYRFVFGLPIPIIVVAWISIFADIIGVLQPVATGIGHIAHLSGFFGVSLIVFLLHKKDQKVKLGFFINMLTLLAAVLIAVMFPGFKINIPGAVE